MPQPHTRLSTLKKSTPDFFLTMRDRLLEAPWTRSLTEKQLECVANETEVHAFSGGSVVAYQGEAACHWIGVLDGMVKVDIVSSEGRGTTFLGVSSGGWLGEGSLLKRELRPYEVVTIRDSWIALMPISIFESLFETSLSFNQFLVRQLNARLGQFASVLESSRIQSTTTQVAVCIAELFNPALCSATSEILRLSQDEIARLCGLSRQIANKALHELQNAGLLKMQYGTIHVLDVGGLLNFTRGANSSPILI